MLLSGAEPQTSVYEVDSALCNRLEHTLGRHLLFCGSLADKTGQLQGKLKPLYSAQLCFVCVQTVQERIPPLKRPKHWASQSFIGRTAKKEP